MLTFVSLHPNCDLALVPSLSISFCSAAETEINSGPLSHRILDDCLSWTSRLTHTGIICLPSLSKNTALVRCNKRPKITDFFLSFYLFFFFVRNYMVQVLNLEQGPSPPVKWVCHRWRRRVCNCERASITFQRPRASPLSFSGCGTRCFLSTAFLSFFSHLYPLWIFSLFPTAALL